MSRRLLIGRLIASVPSPVNGIRAVTQRCQGQKTCSVRLGNPSQFSCRQLTSAPTATAVKSGNRLTAFSTMTLCFAGCGAYYIINNRVDGPIECELGGVPVMLSPVLEPATGILFPKLCNGMTLAGCGCRYKYGFVKVYAVGAFFDPLAVSMVKSQSDEEIKKALLDPRYPRTIRIVMNRNLSIEKYTEAILEALEPRMNGDDLDSLEEFKKLNPKVDLVQGAEIEMTIRGDVLLYKNAVGGLGSIRSGVFTRALCATFFDNQSVSPTLVADVLKGIKTL